MRERQELARIVREEPAEIDFAGDYEQPTTEDSAARETHLREYWLAVRKRLWLVVGLTLLLTSMAAVYFARRPNVYEATARVQVDLENSNQSFSKSGSVIFNNSQTDPAYFNTQLHILAGPGLLRRVTKSLELEKNGSFLPQRSGLADAALKRVSGWAGMDAEAGETARAAETGDEATRLAPYLEQLQEGLSVEPVKESRLQIKDTRLIDVNYRHTDPRLAVRVVNSIADTFVVSNMETKTEANTSAGDFLQKRIAELQSQIRQGEERLIEYAKNNQILSLDASQNTVVERLAGLNRQLLEAENERKAAESAFRAAQAPGAAEAQALADGKHIAEAEAKLAELRQRHAQLLVDNTEEWAEVKEVAGQIAVLERQISDSRRNATSVVLTNLETRYRQTLAREESLRAAFNQQRGETLTQNEAAVNYRIIQQEVETNKQLLDGLLQRSKENDVVLAGVPNNIRVIDYGVLPNRPVGPRRAQGVALVLVLSLALSVGLALFLEYMDDSVRSIEDVELLLHLPALSLIPSFGGVTRGLLPGLRRKGAEAAHGAATLLTNLDARSPVVEAYRQLRTSILLSTAGRAPKSLLVTSSLPSEGKTTTSINIALSLSQIGARVLIIDADMRRPRLHSYFDVPNGRGLSNILSSDARGAEALAMVQQYGSSDLYVLTSGPVPPNPAELLASAQMRDLLATFEDAFTHVVIDTPPAASFTDGVLISPLVDGVLLVVHAGRSSRALARRTRQTLFNVGARLIGVVLNDVKQQSHDYYYQGYYQSDSYSAVSEAELLSPKTT